MLTFNNYYKVIFVNGIRNPSPKDAEQNRKEIARRIGLSVELHHNPTGVDDGVFYPDSLSSKKCAKSLKIKICNCIREKKFLFLFLHSKGAHIGLRAMHAVYKQYPSEVRKLVFIRSYGGVCLLPTHYGHPSNGVVNIFCKGDSPAIDGGWRMRKSFASAGRITRNMKTYGDLQGIFGWVFDDISLNDDSLHTVTLKKNTFLVRRVHGSTLSTFDLTGISQHMMSNAYMQSISRDTIAEFSSQIKNYVKTKRQQQKQDKKIARKTSRICGRASASKISC